MARIPDRTALGARDPRAVRGVRDFPTTNPVFTAVQNLGSTISQAGERLQHQLEEQQAFGAQNRFLELENQWRQTYAERAEGVTPGASGFTESFREPFDESAREFLRTVPKDLQPEYQGRLLRLGGSIRESAGKFEREERDRFSLQKIGEGQEVLLSRQASDPESWAAVQEEGEALIRNSGIPPILADQKIQEWRGRRAEALWLTDSEVDPEGARGRLGAAPGGFVDMVVGAESSGRSSARNPNSTAVGAGQFLEGTWAEFIEERHPELLAQGDIQKHRTDADLSHEAVQWYADKNGATLRNAGLPVTNGTLYLAHFAGPGGATKLLQADPDASAEDVLGSAVVNANPHLKGKTAADVIAWADRKMGGAGIPTGEAAPAPQYEGIPFEKRMALRDSSIVAEKRAKREAYTAETEGLREVREEITKTGYDMMLADQTATPGTPPHLTPDWLEANRDILNVSDYKAFTKFLQPDQQTKRTPPKEYIRLLDLAESDPEQAIEEVRTLYANDVIAKDVFTTVISRARAKVKAAGGRNFASELRSYVSTAMTPGERDPDSYQARKLDALFQFDDWLEKHPDADRETIRKYAEGVIGDYRKIRYKSGVTSLPLPRFVTASPDTLTEAHLSEAGTRIRAEIQAERMTAHEAAEQAALMRRWLDILRYRD